MSGCRMKRLLTTLVILTERFTPSLAVGYEMKRSDLVYTDGLYYKKSTTEPFTGKVVGDRQGTLRKGKWHGPFARFYASESLWTKGTFKNGKAQGEWVSYQRNGKLWKKGTYKDGKEEGLWVYFNKDGTKDTVLSGTWRDGEKVSD